MGFGLSNYKLTKKIQPIPSVRKLFPILRFLFVHTCHQCPVPKRAGRLHCKTPIWKRVAIQKQRQGQLWVINAMTLNQGEMVASAALLQATLLHIATQHTQQAGTVVVSQMQEEDMDVSMNNPLL